MPSFALRASEKSCRSSPSLFELRRNLAEALAKADLGEGRPWRKQTLAKADLSEGGKPVWVIVKVMAVNSYQP